MLWEHHRLFSDAPEILALTEQVNAGFDLKLRSNGTQLQSLFGNVFPSWPAYEDWVSNLKSKRQERCVFGPIVPPHEPGDYLAWASLETLRSIAKANGLRAKRSKQETAEVLRAALSPSSLFVATSEGRDLWKRYGWAPYTLTPFAVLECTISSIEATGKRCALLLACYDSSGLRWVTNGGNTVCDACAKHSDRIFSAKAALEQPESMPPLHPGCTCGAILVTTLSLDPAVGSEEVSFTLPQMMSQRQ